MSYTDLYEALFGKIFSFLPFDFGYILISSALLGALLFKKLFYIKGKFWKELRWNSYKILIYGLVAFIVIYTSTYPVAAFITLMCGDIYDFTEKFTYVHGVMINLTVFFTLIFLYPSKWIPENKREKFFINNFTTYCFVSLALILFSAIMAIATEFFGSKAGFVDGYFERSSFLLWLTFLIVLLTAEATVGDLTKNSFWNKAYKKIKSDFLTKKVICTFAIIIPLYVIFAFYIFFPNSTLGQNLKVKKIEIEQQIRTKNPEFSIDPNYYKITYEEDFNVETKLLKKVLLSYKKGEDPNIKEEYFVLDYNFIQFPWYMESFYCKDFEVKREMLISDLEDYVDINDQYFKEEINKFSMIKIRDKDKKKEYCLFKGEPFMKYSLRYGYVYKQKLTKKFRRGKKYIDLNYYFYPKTCLGKISYHRNNPIEFSFEGSLLDYNGPEPHCKPKEKYRYCSIYGNQRDGFGISFTVKKEAANSGVFYIDFNCES